MIRRMRLIADDELDRMRERQLASYDPTLRMANRTDQEMRETIDDESKPIEVRIELLRAQEERLRSLLAMAKQVPTLTTTTKAATRVEAPGVAPAAAPANATIEPAELEALVDRSMRSVTVKSRGKARAALSELFRTRSDVVSVDKNMRLVLKGEPVEGSNMTDLVQAMYVPTLKHMPAHGEEFVNALRSINFPVSLVTNTTFKKHLASPLTLSDSRGELESTPFKEAHSFRLDSPSTPARGSNQSGKGVRKRTVRFAARATLLANHCAARKSKVRKPQHERVMRLYP